MAVHILRDTGDDNPRVAFEFDFGIRLGLVFITQAACLSSLAVLGLLFYMVHGVIRVRRTTPHHMIRSSHIQWYFTSLMVSDLIQAIGGILNVRWVRDAGVVEGPYCTAQGILKQVGDVGVALASLAIAIHTFSVIVFRWRPARSMKIPALVVSAIWIFLALIISLSLATHKGKSYYGDTQYWCWITKDYLAQGIGLEYVWMWTAALLNIALYIPITLVLKGFITVDGLHVQFHNSRERYRSSLASSSKKPSVVDRIALKMLAYPALYTLTVLPIAIVRWDEFYDHQVPWAATVVADVIFSASGLFNVLLFTITRPTLLPHREHDSLSTNAMRIDHHTTFSLSSIISHPAFPVNSVGIVSMDPDGLHSPNALRPKTADLDDSVKLHTFTPSPTHSVTSFTTPTS